MSSHRAADIRPYKLAFHVGIMTGNNDVGDARNADFIYGCGERCNKCNVEMRIRCCLVRINFK